MGWYIERGRVRITSFVVNSGLVQNLRFQRK